MVSLNAFKKPFVGLFLSLFFVVFEAQASATRSDFERCDKIAVALLEACLAESLARDSKCWGMSKEAFFACKDEINAMYSSDQQEERRRAEEEAKRELEMQRAAEMEQPESAK